MTGVYFLYLDKSLVYIGQSVNIDNRVRYHHINYDMVSIINCERHELKSMERQMIRRYKPQMNRMRYKHPDGSFPGVLSIKLNRHLRDHLIIKAKERNMRLGTYIKAILKKYTGYKEKELV